MRTFEQIKTDILAGNPSRKYILNDVEFEQTDAEFQEAIENRAKMELAQEQYAQELQQQRLTKISAYRKLNMTDEEIMLLLGLTEQEVSELLGGN